MFLMSFYLFEYLTNLKVKFWNCAEDLTVAHVVPCSKSVNNGVEARNGIRAGILAVSTEGSGNLGAVSLWLTECVSECVCLRFLN